VYHVSLFSDFGKMGRFFVHVSKRGFKALYYKDLSYFLAIVLSITTTKTAHFIYCTTYFHKKD
ncbi:hypothetical protein QA354_09725, partial [Glaesserella parasuis]|nr:hypothetical protein [Glaesserella parasuis]MDG6295682.1 hypothetical protein [Glaesserella parasuis]MDG6792041.1 hypothetical protein [Glaesserella parasuis]